MAYDNNRKGILSRNERKRPDKKDPDFQGSCEIDGVHWWIAGWIKESGPQSKTPGRRFFSLSFTPKEAEKPAQTTPVAEAKPPQPNVGDEDVPF